MAHAHAAIVSSDPEPGQQLSSAPGVVVLRFTEPINGRLSRATVTDPNGRLFDGAAVEAREIRVRLLTDAPGVYTIAWTTVSTLDGHTLSGGFRFGVRVDPGGTEAVISLAPQRSDLVVAVLRTVEYTALLATVGMLLLRHLARRDPPLAWVRPPLELPLSLALVAGTAVVAGEALAAASTPSPSALFDYLTNGLPGAARLARISAELAALSLATLESRMIPVSVLAAILALAGAGHAAAAQPAWWGIGADAIHLAAAGLWAGGIIALATLRPPGGWRGPAVRSLVGRFSPVAVAAFVVTVAFGTLRSAQELSDVGELFTSPYGQVLTAKVLAVLAMVPLSILARRRLVAPRVEAGLGVLVIGAAALLAAFPLPPGRLVEAEAARERPSLASALPRDGDLTLGADAGDALLGLTLRPGNPGPNEALIFVLPDEGEPAAAGLRVDLVVAGQSIQVRQCGATCRSAQVEAQGGEHVEIRVGGTKGGIASFDLPTLPAPEGAPLLQQMQERMGKLNTLRYEEILGPGDSAIHTEYSLQAPDRISYQIKAGAALVWIGGTRYLRVGPDAPWQAEEAGLRLEVPLYTWDPPAVRRLVAPRVLGQSSLGGADTQVVSFFGEAGSLPVWFRLWVDADGLVHRAEMRAPGHFMDHRYFAFDADFTIEAPVP
jgi:copper transport protein